MHYTCRHISVPKSSSFFSKHWETEPDDSLIFIKRGHLFGLITLKADYSPNDIGQIGSQIIAYINETYFSLDGSLFSSRLKFCLDQVQIRWSDYQPSIVLAAINGQTMAVSSLGFASLFLKRHDQFSSLLDSDSDQIQLVTGPVADNDLLFLTHPLIINQIDNLSTFFSLDGFDDQEEFLSNQIDNPASASLLIQVHHPIDSVRQDSDTPTKEEPVQSNPLSFDSTSFSSSPKPKLPGFFQKIFAKKPLTVPHQPFKADQSKKKLNLIIGTLATLGLFVSITLGTIKKNQADKLSQFQSLEQQILSNLDTINRLRSLNIEDAKIEAQKAQELVSQMSVLNLYPEKVNDYRSQIDTILSQTGSVSTKLEKFYDTVHIVNNRSYSKIIYLSNHFYLLDSQNGRIDSITLNGQAKSTALVSSDPQTKDVISFTLLKSNLYALTKDGLYQVTKTNWPKQFSIDDHSYLAVNSWGSSLYLLSSNSISKSALVNNALADPTTWLKSDQSLVPAPSDISIDSRIWVLSQSGQVEVYLRGIKDNFNLSTPPTTSTASHLIVAQDKDLLLFLADSKTVVVYTKTGELISKYNLADYDIKSIALDEESSILYLLASDQIIYKLTL